MKDVEQTPVVDTNAGQLQGYRSPEDVMIFKGIPYGAPTSGAARFLPPSPVTPWTDVRRAVEYGPSSPQLIPAEMPAGMSPDENQSEDCLVLNVWTRSCDPGARRPVMVWFHGGGYRAGSGSDPTTDGTAFAGRGDIVVVSVNHRLDIFGYLHLGEVLGSDYAQSGNAGTLDLVQALRWVRDNIEAFGGDPGNVTIAGPSGGGHKVMTLMAAPTAKGLFRRAIVSSGHDLYRSMSTDEADQVARGVLERLGGATAARDTLMAAPVDALLDASIATTIDLGQPRSGADGFFNYGVLAPVVDGEVLVDEPINAIAAGEATGVSLMIGTQLFDHVLPGVQGNDFYTSFNSSVTNGEPTVRPWLDRYGSLTDADLRHIIRPVWREHTEGIVDEYLRLRPGSSETTLLGTIMADSDWRIPAIRLADATVAGGGDRVFMYFLAHAFPPVAMHHHVFLTLGPPSPFGGHAHGLQDQIHSSWVSFVKDGVPRHDRLPTWPAYEPEMRATMVLDYDCHVANDPWGDERKLWDGLR